MPKRAKQQRTKRAQPVENRSVEYLTVGWMLMVITTFLCELAAAACHLYVVWGDRQARTVELFSGLLLFAAFVIGGLSLIVCSVVVKSRRDSPPRSILIFAVVVGIAPLVTLLLQAVQ
jgi:hypothetical protein